MGSQVPNPWVFFDIKVDDVEVGRIVFELRFDVCPKASENFRCLCKGWGKTEGGRPLHFKGTRFFRILPGCVLQGGDIVSDDGTDGCSIWNENFADENFLLRHTGPGVLSMANSGPDSNNSRFFISLNKNSWMDDRHVVFGYVMSGMEVVRLIEAKGTLQTGEPKARVVISDSGEITPQVQ